MTAPWLPTADAVSERVEAMLDRDSVNLGPESGQDRLMLMLTRSCELRCSYCFVGLSEEGAGRDHPGTVDPAVLADPPGQPVGDMSAQTLQKAIDWLMRAERPKLGVQLFGGEPSRRWRHLVAALRYAHGHPGRAGRPIEFLFTTNGLGITPKRLDKLDGLPVTIQFSLDGGARGNRFRRPLEGDLEAAWRRTRASIAALQGSGVAWFMNATIPPAAADELVERYQWAREVGAPALQINYATGMAWKPAQVAAYLGGLQRILDHHRADPGDLQLFNWNNGADPAPLCGDMIVDVDGSIYQVGALFHERRSPWLKRTYRIGHLDRATRFTGQRWSLRELAARTRDALADQPRQCEVFFDNVRLGAAVELVVERARAAGVPDQRSLS
jgi:pyruvate-formate lyase-activating enzyme